MNDEQVWAIVLDDDAAVARGLERLLVGLGVGVFATTSASVAMGVLRGAPAMPAFILTDFHMPEMLGSAFIAKARAEFGAGCPPFVVMSGGLSGADMLPGDVPLIEKPVNTDVLFQRLRERGVVVEKRQR